MTSEAQLLSNSREQLFKYFVYSVWFVLVGYLIFYTYMEYWLIAGIVLSSVALLTPLTLVLYKFGYQNFAKILFRGAIISKMFGIIGYL